jgi:hypothetical protein
LVSCGGARSDLNVWLGFLVFFGDCESGSVASLGADGTLGWGLAAVRLGSCAGWSVSVVRGRRSVYVIGSDPRHGFGGAPGAGVLEAEPLDAWPLATGD